MKFSEYWLREWVNPAFLDRNELLNQITMAGLEVVDVKPVADMFHGVVVGQIIQCSPHSKIDKVYSNIINIGNERLLKINCSAPNCKKGLKVVVAPLDTVFFKKFNIKLHNEISEGMLCSFSELGILNYHISNIIELPDDAPIGANIRNYLNLDDNSIEISIPYNRPDCLSIIGIARDVAVLNNLSLKTSLVELVKATIHDTISIHVNDTNACPRYLGRIIKHINVNTKTPLWICEKLRRCGDLSTNPILNIINYVLLEFGQPIHVFDLDQINGGITVRMAKETEKITLVDNTEIALNSDTLIVADRNKVLSIGGILVGKDSYISHTTQNILLESAFFNPLSIIGCSRCYGLYTNSSQRYERGVDSELQYKAMERVTNLLLNICGGKAGPIIDKTDIQSLPQRIVITLRREKLNNLIGCNITDKIIMTILVGLGCDINVGIDQWKVTVPSWRFDLKIEEDLIEEIIRIYGYDKIPATPIKANLIMTQHLETNLSLKRVKNLLVDKGYQEAITYSFVDPKIQKLLHFNAKALILPNPISNNMSVMRLSLWTGLLNAVVYNYKRQQGCIRLFETGLRFTPNVQAEFGISQDFVISGIMSGNCYEEHWDLTFRPVDFYDLKGDLESLLSLTGQLESFVFRAKQHPALHPGQSAAIYLYDECIGFIGTIHPRLAHELNINRHTIMFELLWNKISNRILPRACEVSRFPSNRRDIAVVVDENVAAADIILECKKIAKDQLVDIKLFDIYRGKSICKGNKSFAISLILQDNKRTLEEKEIVAIVNNCIVALKERFQATLRN
ncbi:phenylalanine--tRNA ligase subunit beta [Pantoea sp. Mhis]|uniref:phenylalanine--tRNA ligase subunit beta n=1 Tax=Pantoea sp. Mhis TaxID=2576759 RepID=UPI001357EA95|nr:phenylalanine--tRNA ligase subunit beta [Pantoea sp. Mhis]MXP56333.1 phenylalanine--tRNA ligase subunit beta [Pantoea sp. Mhis]